MSWQIRVFLMAGLMGTLMFLFGGGPLSDQEKSRQNRESMVSIQLEGRDVRDVRVLNAMRKVERHRFVSESELAHAYDDFPLPIGHGQTISQPYIVAKMSELAQLSGSERVLEVGTGSGYQAAVLAELAKEVFSIEIVTPLYEQSRALLHELGYGNVQVRCGDGYRGWPEAAPFDAILVTAAPKTIPEPLVSQLKPGGRLVIPVGQEYQELVVLTKNSEGKIPKSTIFPVSFVPMTGEAQRKP